MSACKYCASPIDWNRIAGNWRPTNADGSAHLCSAKRHIPDVNLKLGKPITGAQYKPSCGECAIPPWEICPCSALLA